MPLQDRSRWQISIRAPARGATLVILGLPTKLHISIRAPARGATESVDIPHCHIGISIRAPARGATFTDFQFLSPFTISIRAPARGATNDPVLRLVLVDNFNPRSREGSDAINCARCSGVYLFQSALPRGERRHHMSCHHRICEFQSALPRGERHQFSPKNSLRS